MKKLIIFSAAMMALGVNAQNVIDFETPGQGYKSIGVYDVWEESPFRTGQLTGNVGLTANPDVLPGAITGEVANGSETVLGAQRSRFGSNRFGVRVDLAEEIAITPAPKYVHVMLHTPMEGRVMLVGLGSRSERPGQNPFTEQFWTFSSSTVKPGEWCDAVFAVSGNTGINVRSLVLVPHCESPHALTEDFLFYIDNIEVNNSSLPRITNEFYPISGSKTTTSISRSDRFSTTVKLTIGQDEQTKPLAQSTNKLLYQDLTNETFYAKPGQSVVAAISYPRDWMHAYCYVDYNNDGRFETGVNADGTPSADSELVAYNYYEGKNSLGENAQQNQGNPGSGIMPKFDIPEDLAAGMYRMRMKIDWNNIDPLGNPGDSNGQNEITSNGGVIIDVMLCVYGDEVTVNDFQLNGEVLAGDGTKLNALKVPSNQPFVVKSAPEKGFHNEGIDITYGFNLNGDAVDRYGNPQHSTLSVPKEAFDSEDCYTIPADIMRGDILINGHMVENKGEEPEEPVEPVNPGGESGIEEIGGGETSAPTIYNLQGIPTSNPRRGQIYIINHKKVLID